MKIHKYNLLLIIAVLMTSSMVAQTFARYTSAVTGGDTALVSKWGFNVNVGGKEGLDLGLFDKPLVPMAKGSKIFTFSSGNSDVDMDYLISMNLKDLLPSYFSYNNQDILMQAIPIVFRVSATSTGVTQPQYVEAWQTANTWFPPLSSADVGIMKGKFLKNTNDIVEVTIDWEWNTSHFVGNPPAYLGNPEYYNVATNEYDRLNADYKGKIRYANEYMMQHNYSTDENGVAGWFCTLGMTAEGVPTDCGANHSLTYDNLRGDVDRAKALRDGCIKVQYDKYDTEIIQNIAKRKQDIKNPDIYAIVLLSATQIVPSK